MANSRDYYRSLSLRNKLNQIRGIAQRNNEENMVVIDVDIAEQMVRDPLEVNKTEIDDQENVQENQNSKDQESKDGPIYNENYEDAEEKQKKEKNTYKSYSISFKKAVLDTAEKFNADYASYKHSVPYSTLVKWRRRSEGGLENLKDMRLQNGRPFEEELDQKLREYFEALRKKGIPVSGKMLQEKAKSIRDGDPNFKASSGWLRQFVIGIKL